MFKQKLNNVVENIYRGELQMALNNLDQIVQKGKKQKNNLTNENMRSLNIIKVNKNLYASAIVYANSSGMDRVSRSWMN